MNFFFFFLIHSFSLFAVVPDSTITRLQKIYPDRSRESLLEVISNSKSSFELWRAFPAYTYEMIQRKYSNVVLNFVGHCAGDAHAENFGFLFSEENNKTIFTINDLDDSAPCKLEADLIRLLAGNLFLLQEQTNDQLRSYLNGLEGKTPDFESIKNLEAESMKKGGQLTKKFRQLFENNCGGDYSELSEAEISTVKIYLENSQRKYLRACSRVKENGGSAGLKRYVIFFEKLQGVGALELKPLVTPAPLFSSSISKIQRAEIYHNSVRLLLGEAYQASYRAAFLNDKLFLERPLIAGNVDVDIKDFPNDSLKLLLSLESHVLGSIHRKSNFSSTLVDPKKIVPLAHELHQLFKKEFGIP